MSSETSTDDYEVDVAPLPQRSKTIRIEDEPSAPAFQLNPKVQLLNQHGRLQSFSQPRQLERMCPSVETRQLVKMLNNAELPSSATAEAALGHLRDFFHPIPEFSYQRDKPSHAWDKDGIDPKSWFKLLMELCSETEKLLRSEPMVLQFDGNPAYVMGDLHGNYKDLMQFAETFWKLGLRLCPARIVCLGDYVDRGPHSIETIAYLFAQKLLAPKKISLLRGNHELKDVNGDMDTYGAGSFLAQCRSRFGVGKGDDFWRAANRCFDQMPVSAVLDKRIFCVHGGVPREAIRKSNFSFRDITSIPKGYVDTDTSEVLLDLLWADPSTNHEEDTVDHDDRFPDGFAPNNTRAGNTCLFGTHAVNQFMRRTGITHIIRAHQPPNLGISFGKRAQVITVFSSSHYCGGFNSAAVVLVADHKVNVIVTSGAAGNQEDTTTALKGKKAEKVKAEEEEEEEEGEESDEEKANGDAKGAKPKKRKNDGFKVPLTPSTKRKTAAVAVAPVPGDDNVRASALGAVGVKRARRKSGV